MATGGTSPLVSAGDVSAAALVIAPFLALLAVLNDIAPHDAEELVQSDPLTQTLDALGGVWLVPVLGAAVVGAWVWRHRPTKVELQRAALWAGAGAAFATVVTAALSALLDGRFPDFIPPEESAKPGLLLGLSAGVLEEILFRLGTLPVIYFALQDRTPRWTGVALAALATGLLFALSHELPPAVGAFEARYFATRTIFPGVVMSLVFFRPGPAFVISAHCTAHVCIPFLFA